MFLEKSQWRSDYSCAVTLKVQNLASSMSNHRAHAALEVRPSAQRGESMVGRHADEFRDNVALIRSKTSHFFSRTWSRRGSCSKSSFQFLLFASTGYVYYIYIYQDMTRRIRVRNGLQKHQWQKSKSTKQIPTSISPNTCLALSGKWWFMAAWVRVHLSYFLLEPQE